MDTTAPGYAFVPNTKMTDERYLNVGFAADGTPSYAKPGTAVDTVLNGSTPTIYRYASRAGVPANPLQWLITGTDANTATGDGSGVASVDYWLKYPGSKNGGFVAQTGFAGASVVAGEQYAIPIPAAGWSGADVATVNDKLKKVKGTFQVELVIHDKAGNASSVLTFQFVNDPLPPPLYITAANGAGDAASPYSAAAWALPDNNVASLINGTFGTEEAPGLMNLTVKNKTGEPAYVGVFLPEDGRTVTYSGEVWRDYLDVSAAPYSSPCGIQPYDATTGACLGPWGVGTRGLHGTTSNQSAVVDAFVTETDGTARCQGAGCFSTVAAANGDMDGQDDISGSGSRPFHEYLVPNGATIHLVVAAERFDFLSPDLSQDAQETAYRHKAGSSSPSTVAVGADAITCTSSDGDSTCFAARRYRRYEALRSTNVTVSNLAAYVRAAPDVQGTMRRVASGKDLPYYPDRIDQTPVAVSPVIWSSSEPDL